MSRTAGRLRSRATATLSDSDDDPGRLIAALRAAEAAVRDHTDSLPSSALVVADPTWQQLVVRARAARERLAGWVRSVEDQVAAGDASCNDRALAYLRADPYYFRSGYTRDRLAGRLARGRLIAEQRAHVRDYIRRCVDGDLHCRSIELGRLARATADNELRRHLLSRLHASDTRIAARALRVLAPVRHPGLNEGDVEAARGLVVDEASEGPWLAPVVERLARWLWEPEWEAELRVVAAHHGPRRAGAKRLLARTAARRARRPGP